MRTPNDNLATRLYSVRTLFRARAATARDEDRAVMAETNLQRLRVVASLVAAATPLLLVLDVENLVGRETPLSDLMWAELAAVRAILFLGSVVFLLLSRGRQVTGTLRRGDHLLETGFVAFCLIVAAIVAGLGQQVRPSIGAYLLSLFIASAFVHMDGRRTLLAYVPAWLVLVTLLFRYEAESLRWPDLVNGTLMTLLALVLSRMTYCGRVQELSNARVMDRQRLELEMANRQLAESNAMLRRLSYVDALTEVPNRRWLDEFLTREWTRSIRERTSIALIMADLDHFKRLNDQLGHQVGDRCLYEVAAALRKAILRPADFLARYGGEEFAVVLPDTDIEGARLVAERLQRAVDRLEIPVPDGATARVTVSLGVASLRPTRNILPDDLVAAADQALYQAKAAGRAQYVCAS